MMQALKEWGNQARQSLINNRIDDALDNWAETIQALNAGGYFLVADTKSRIGNPNLVPVRLEYFPEYDIRNRQSEEQIL